MASIMEMAWRQQRQPPTGPASASEPGGPATGRPLVGPASAALPAGASGVGLDRFAQGRAQALGEFQQLQANGATLIRQYGHDAYNQALENARAKATQADAEFRRAAAAQGLGQFVE